VTDEIKSMIVTGRVENKSWKEIAKLVGHSPKWVKYVAVTYLNMSTRRRK